MLGTRAVSQAARIGGELLLVKDYMSKKKLETLNRGNSANPTSTILCCHFQWQCHLSQQGQCAHRCNPIKTPAWKSPFLGNSRNRCACFQAGGEAVPTTYNSKPSVFPWGRWDQQLPKGCAMCIASFFQRILQFLSSSLKPLYAESGIWEFPASQAKRLKVCNCHWLTGGTVGKRPGDELSHLLTCRVMSTSRIESSEAQAKSPSNTNSSSCSFSLVSPGFCTILTGPHHSDLHTTSLYKSHVWGWCWPGKTRL